VSYCRIGEDSDVYVVKNLDHFGGGWTCFCDSRFHGNTYDAIIMHLIEHRRIGDKVPERVFDRLYAEQAGRPWKTDVELALEELNLDQIGLESPEALLLDKPPEDK
jgi:hypothetical protein